jgi:hypothetical protein
LRWGFSSNAVVRFILAVGIAGVATAFLALHAPQKLQAHTDIVGATTFANFDVDYYFTLYYLVVLFFPIASLLLFLLLTWIARRLGGAASGSRPLITAASAEISDSEYSLKAYAVQTARLAATGALLGLEVAIGRGSRPAGFWKVEAGAVLIYCFAVVAIAGAWRRFRPGRSSTLALLAGTNALAAPFTILGMLAASGATQVTVISTGTVQHWPWLPIWLAASLAIIALLTIGTALAQVKSERGTQQLERWVLILILGSVGLYLIVVAIPGGYGPMDVFHEGEQLVPAQLMLHGAFPWRDIMSAHGPLQDIYASLTGMLIFERSRWGAGAGFAMVLAPLYVVCLYVLYVYLFRRSWPFLLLSMIGFLIPLLAQTHFRFVLWPVVLLLLAAVLNKPVPGRIIVFIVALGVQAILTPEAAYTLPACAAVIVGYEIYHFDRERSIQANFRRTIGSAVASLVFFGVFSAYLVSQHAFSDFLFYYHIASEGHQYTGAFPIDHLLKATDHPLRDRFAVAAPPAALIISFWYAATRLRLRLPFRTADWIMGATAIFILLYYQKFLTRADEHVYHPYAMTVPLLLYIVYRAIAAVEGWLRSKPWGDAFGRAVSRYPLALALLVIAILAVPGTMPVWLDNTPGRYRSTTPTPPSLQRLGYEIGGLNMALYSDLDTLLRAYVKPGDKVFDFANEPGLYFYLLNYVPATRYYHVSLAIPEDAQHDLIGRLRTAQPKLIVFTDDALGQPGWDYIPNMVRHYDVSQYIFDHYRPLVIVHGQMLYVDARLNVPAPTSLHLKVTEPLITDNIPFRGAQCDWGYTPNFFSVTPTPAPGRQALTVPVHQSTVPGGPNGAPLPFQITLPARTHWTDFRWMEIDTSTHFRADSLALYDSMTPGLQRQISFKTLEDSPTHYLVRVGSCSQWYGYGGQKLFLGHMQPQDIATVRLVP